VRVCHSERIEDITDYFTGDALLPEHEYLDDDVSGARLECSAPDRLRDNIRRAELDAVVLLSPDRLARDHAH
jgi:hypothetical protein